MCPICREVRVQHAHLNPPLCVEPREAHGQSRAVTANVSPPTLKTEIARPNGNSSTADGLARHHRRSESAVTSLEAAYPPPRVLDRGGSHTRTGERHMRDSAGRRGGLDLVVLLEAL